MQSSLPARTISLPAVPGVSAWGLKVLAVHPWVIFYSLSLHCSSLSFSALSSTQMKDHKIPNRITKGGRCLFVFFSSPELKGSLSGDANSASHWGEQTALALHQLQQHFSSRLLENQRITEELRLAQTSGCHLLQPPACAGPPKTSCPGPHPGSFWMCLRMETPQPLRAMCGSLTTLTVIFFFLC